MSNPVLRSIATSLLTALVAGGLSVATAFAQAAPEKAGTSASTTDASKSPAPSATHAPSRYRPETMSTHAIEHYQLLWGVDSFVVKTVESGQMIRFSYRVTDAKKAAAVNDKKATPYLVDQAARVKLVVPSMEKVGQLRQSSTPEEGKSYWMVFSNKGEVVKRGDHVSVEIGKFRVDGLVVQ
jgi:hypothetical protein